MARRDRARRAPRPRDQVDRAPARWGGDERGLAALDRRIADNVQQLREKKWNKKEFSVARGLYGRTLGVLGHADMLYHPCCAPDLSPSPAGSEGSATVATKSTARRHLIGSYVSPQVLEGQGGNIITLLGAARKTLHFTHDTVNQLCR